MDSKGRRYQKYWYSLKDKIKLTKKERSDISDLFGVKLNVVDKAIKDNDIEYFRDLRHTSKGMIGDSKSESKDLLDTRKIFFISKNINPDDYPIN